MYRKVRFKYVFTLAIFILTLTYCKSDENSNNSSKTDDEIVKNKDFEEQTYEMPVKSLYSNEKKEFMYDYFYPIGWSADGKFAYIYEPADEATGFYFFILEIKDLQTGKIVWKFEIGPDEEIEDGSLKKIWEQNSEKFVSALNENKIIQSNDFKIDQFPIIKGKKTFNLNEDIKYKKGEAGFTIDFVSDVEISISLKNNKSKKIFNESLKGDFVLNAYSSGYYKSTFGGFIAIILISEMRGYEGPPNVLRINTIGCNLDEISE